MVPTGKFPGSDHADHSSARRKTPLGLVVFGTTSSSSGVAVRPKKQGKALSPPVSTGVCLHSSLEDMFCVCPSVRVFGSSFFAPGWRGIMSMYHVNVSCQCIMSMYHVNVSCQCMIGIIFLERLGTTPQQLLHQVQFGCKQAQQTRTQQHVVRDRKHIVENNQYNSTCKQAQLEHNTWPQKAHRRRRASTREIRRAQLF